jgi:hypothetical protein
VNPLEPGQADAAGRGTALESAGASVATRSKWLVWFVNVQLGQCSYLAHKAVILQDAASGMQQEVCPAGLSSSSRRSTMTICYGSTAAVLHCARRETPDRLSLVVAAILVLVLPLKP